MFPDLLEIWFVGVCVWARLRVTEAFVTSTCPPLSPGCLDRLTPSHWWLPSASHVFPQDCTSARKTRGQIHSPVPQVQLSNVMRRHVAVEWRTWLSNCVNMGGEEVGAGKGHLRPFHKLPNTFKPGWDDTLTTTGVFSLARPRKSCNFVLPLHESVISLIGRQNMWLDYVASLQAAKLSLGQLQR